MIEIKKITMPLEDMNPPSDLKANVLNRIETVLEKKNLKREILGFSVSFVSILAFIGFIVYTINEFKNSGFYDYVSLAFSDSKLVLNNFGEFMLSVTDSVPFLAITITLLSILILLLSIRYATNIKRSLFYKIN